MHPKPLKISLSRNHFLYAIFYVVMVELTDVVFALDSIPAVIAINQGPFIIYIMTLPQGRQFCSKLNLSKKS
jgi:predicted tellurium resistance membrane protein TerC